MKLAIACIVSSLVVFSLVSGCAGEKPAPKPAPVIMSAPPAEAETPTVAREKLAYTIDPICDMDLEEQVQFTTKHEDKEYGFCSSYCVVEFKKDPKKYIAKLAAGPVKGAAPAAMPGHAPSAAPEATQ